MERQSRDTVRSSHPGGNTAYWQEEQVKKYETQQSLLSERKEEALSVIVRIIKYFHDARRIENARILDLGCGPGTPMTLTAQVQAAIPDCTLTAIDASDQMVATARELQARSDGDRFHAYVCDFNERDFWIPEIDTMYDFIISSGTLHYLSDVRRAPFFKEIYEHMTDNGVFVFGAACHSHEPELSEMQHLFRAEYTYNRLGDRRSDDFHAFREKFEETDQKANINWQSPEVWTGALREAGFSEVDMVWQLWIRGIFVALK